MGTLAVKRARSVSTPQEILAAIEKLPPFPTVALRAMSLVSGTDSSLKELCDVVRCDAVFTAEILRIANSPLIAFSREITNILQASMLLGFRRLRRIVVTVGLRSYMDQSFTPATRACWRHSMACAMVAERITQWNSLDCDFAYTAGILHDIGRVALETVCPQLYADLYEQADVSSEWDSLEREREAFGIDHCEAGRFLMRAWNMPEPLLEATCFHHDSLTLEENAADMIRCSCRLAKALGFAAVPCPGGPGCEQILAEFPQTVRKHLPSIEELTAEIAKEIDVVEAT